MASFLCLLNANHRVLALQMEGVTRSQVDEILLQFARDITKTRIAGFRIASQILQEDDILVVCGTSLLCLDEEAVLLKAVAFVRSIGTSPAVFAKRWMDLFVGLERLVDSGEPVAVAAAREKQSVAQWENFLASSQTECERLAASFASGVAVKAVPAVKAVRTNGPVSPVISPRPTNSPRPAVSPAPPAQPVSPLPVRPASPRPPSPRISPRPPQPALVPTLFLVAPLEPLKPDVTTQAWGTEPITPPAEGVLVLVRERANHFSVGKELSSFFMLMSLVVAPAKTAVYPLSLSFELENCEFADEVVGNPAVSFSVNEGGWCKFTLPHALDSWEVMRVVVQKQFPTSRVPLRIVPMSNGKVLEVTYEMNPILDDMSGLIMEILCAPQDGGDIAVEQVRNKQGEKMDDVFVDVKNKVFFLLILFFFFFESQSRSFVL
jgi:hypothetical protein